MTMLLQFMLLQKKSQKILQNVAWKLVSDPFCVYKKISTTSIGN